MPTCAAVGCTITEKSNIHGKISFYRFPKRRITRTVAWVNALKRKDWEPTSSSRLCSLHFISGTGKPSKDANHPDWVPSVFKHMHKWKDPNKAKNAVRRYERKSLRTNRGFIESGEDDCLIDANAKEVEVDLIPSFNVLTEGKENVAADNKKFSALNNDDNSDSKLLHEELQKASELIEEQNELIQQQRTQLEQVEQLCADKKRLEEKVALLDEQNFYLHGQVMKLKCERKIGFVSCEQTSDDQIHFFTDVPNAKLFQELVSYIMVRHEIKTSNGLQPENQMLLTLMKLRLGLINQDLAYRFNIPRTSVSSIFSKWLDALATECQKVIVWPNRRTLRKHLPTAFNTPEYKDTVVIIDCSEVFIERPSSLQARSQTYSNYKNHNTLKFLIGITPSGAISFLSRCYGGRISDKQITIESGLLDKLKPGDVVLADRGFFISDLVALKGAKLCMPSFTRGKSQLPRKDVEVSRHLSNVRIHVERAIGRMKCFKILRNCMSVSLLKRKTGSTGLSTADKIVIVCAGIVNMGPPLVKESL